MVAPKNPPGSIKSADRALSIIDLVARRRVLRFADIVEDLELPRSSAHGLVGTLLSHGWLEHDPATHTYRLGLRAWFIGQQYDGHQDIARIAKPYMDALRDEFQETVQLARLDGVENVYIAISESERPMRLASSVGMRLHSHATGIGKALLAQLDPSDAEDRLSRVALPSFTPSTVTDVPALLSHLENVRREGYAVDDEEYLLGCRCVAVPVYDDRRGLVVALSITAPSNRCGDDWPDSVRRRLTEAATSIRRRLLLTLGVDESETNAG